MYAIRSYYEQFLERLLRELGLVQEVADEEHDGAAPDDPAQVIEGARDVGAPSLGLEGQQLPDDAQDVPGPLAGRHELLDAVSEAHEPDLVVVLDGRERQSYNFV